MQKDLNNQKIHFLFITLLSLNYIIPLIIFGNVTLFYHDTLDSEIVFNTVIANSFKDNFESLKLFLNEEIKIEFLRRAYQPFTFFYYFLSPETAYLTIDILVKLTAYFSFFILAKKINKNIFVCALVAALYSSINERTVEGFGFAFMPYIIYLISFKEKINFKHIFLIIIFGINTDIVKCLTSLPILALTTYILNSKNKKVFLNHLFLTLSVFIFAIIISNFNLIYGQMKFGEIQRTDFNYEYYSFFKNIVLYFIELFKIPSYDWTLFKHAPYLILTSFIVMIVFFIREKKTLQLILLILLTNLIPFFLRTEFLTEIRNSSSGILKTFQFEYITTITFLIFSLALIKILKHFKNFYIPNFLIILLIYFQINSSIVPVYKKFFLLEENYRNIYTFSEYYLYDDYKKIKSIVQNKKTMSVGYDPMIAVMNNMYVIDGYHNVYPLDYKFKFRKIIQKELEKKDQLKKYYDNWGNRIYAYISNKDKIEINFKEAQSLGANYIISKYEILNSNLRLIKDDFNSKIYLYELNF